MWCEEAQIENPPEGSNSSGGLRVWLMQLSLTGGQFEPVVAIGACGNLSVTAVVGSVDVIVPVPVIIYIPDIGKVKFTT